MNITPDDQPDHEFARLVQEAKRGRGFSWDKGDVVINCLCLIFTVVVTVLLAPSSLVLLVFIFAPSGGMISAFGNTIAAKQAGHSILLGSLLGFIYLAVLSSQW